MEKLKLREIQVHTYIMQKLDFIEAECVAFITVNQDLKIVVVKDEHETKDKGPT